MARHNRWGEGEDQCGFRYRISYPPDWLDRIRVTRRLPGGRQSTKTLFRNPSRVPGLEADRRVRARIESPEQGLEIEVSLRPARDGVGKLSVEWRPRPRPRHLRVPGLSTGRRRPAPLRRPADSSRRFGRRYRF